MKFLLSILFLFSMAFSQEINLTQEEKDFLHKYPVLKISNQKNWPPYDYNEKGVPKGISIELMELIREKLGMKFEYVYDDWNKLLEKIKNREIDVIHTINKSKKREKYLNFTSSYMQYHRHFIIRKDSSINSFKQLEGKTFVYGAGWLIGEKIKRNHPKVDLWEVKGTPETFEAVSLGEADAAMNDAYTFYYFNKLHKYDNLKVGERAAVAGFSNRLLLGVRKDLPILRDILQKAIFAIDQEKEAELWKRWGE